MPEILYIYAMKQTVKLLEIPDVETAENFNSTADIVIGDHFPASTVLSLYTNRNVKHIIQKSNLCSETEIKAASTMLLAPQQFIDFPLATIFGHENPDQALENSLAQYSFYMSDVDQKTEYLDMLEDYVQQYASPKSMSLDVRAVADEVITNSVFNAPFVDMENSFSGPTRDKGKVMIDPNKKPYSFVGKDTQRFVFGCKDYYGRLNVRKLIARIQLCYQNNPGQQINYGPGGAGIGSFMIFDSCVSLYVAVDANKSTTLCCVFPLNMAARQRHLVPKNLHIYF